MRAAKTAPSCSPWLVTRNGRPLLGIPQFKERTVNYHDILKGLYLGGLRDEPDIRKKTQELYSINTGYGKCYLVNTKVMDEMGLDGEMLAHNEHEDSLVHFRSCGLIADEKKWPILMDSRQAIMALPPIINSELTRLRPS